MKTLLFILFITLFLSACQYLGNHPTPTVNRCSKYGCGNGGTCGQISENRSIRCICNDDYELYYTPFGIEKSYCIAKPKQFIINGHRIVLSNYGSNVPEDVDPNNKFLYFGDSAEVYSGFYLVDDYKSIKLLDFKYEVYDEVFFDKEIKSIIVNNDVFYNIVILFQDGSIEVYDRTFSNKLIKFSNGDNKIIKISPNSFLSLENEFIYYDIKEPASNAEEWELSTKYIEELSPSLDLINNNCSLMEDSENTGKKVIKCIEDDIITTPYEFIKDDEQILWVKDNCTYTDKNRLYCKFDGKQRVKEDIYIKTTNKDHFGSDPAEFCYLDDYLYSCINYNNMEFLEN